MGRLREQLRHAFAVDDPDAFDPPEEQRQVVDMVACRVARHGMTTPVQILLETGQPYNYLLSQTMHFFRPTTSILLRTFAPFLPAGTNYRSATEAYQHLADFFEHRGSIEYLRDRVHHFEDEFRRRERQPGCKSSSQREVHDATATHLHSAPPDEHATRDHSA